MIRTYKTFIKCPFCDEEVELVYNMVTDKLIAPDYMSNSREVEIVTLNCPECQADFDTDDFIAAISGD